VERISPHALFCLWNYPWPGNVNELITALKKSIRLMDSDETVIDVLHLPQEISFTMPFVTDMERWLGNDDLFWALLDKEEIDGELLSSSFRSLSVSVNQRKGFKLDKVRVTHNILDSDASIFVDEPETNDD
jgi:DNA-binding NtrC family response regulator